jgi:pimeloyl-ACP methyl ester carboxylesterase
MRKETEMKRAVGVTVVLLLVLLAQTAHAKGPHFPPPPVEDYDLFLDQVELRPGVTSDIHVKVFVNDEQPRFGKTVFAIPGWNCTAEIWDQYAEALFTHPFKGVKTSRVVAIDLPGHGQSTPPTGIYFGQLLLDDYVTAILAALDGLRGEGVCPQVIIGYSQGGLLVPMVQQRLVDSGSSLFEEYGIFRAVLLAPSPAAPIEWHQTTDGTAEGMVAYFLVTGGPDYDLLWYHFHVPEGWWPFVFFTNFLGEVSPDTPTPEEIAARGYRAPAPLFSSMQLMGYAGEIPGYPGEQPFFPRPEVPPGIFGLQSGTLLHVVSFVDDTMIYPSESAEVFDHLICCPVLSRNTVVEAEGDVHDRVHMLPVTNPSVVIEAMSDNGWFVW